jgi:hypothetical protein
MCFAVPRQRIGFNRKCLSIHLVPITTAKEVAVMPIGEGEMLLTVFLKHDQTMALDEINEHHAKTGFWKIFPPEGIEVVSWYVMMGIGQVVTLKLPGHRLRDVNLAIEKSAWGGFSTEFYPTYDFMPVWEGIKARQAKDD